jgi:uncharacterized membrane protein YphA (DoxX/SURF4 family)
MAGRRTSHSEGKPAVNDSPGLLARIDRTGLSLLVARLVIGWVLIRYSLHKIAEPTDFLRQVHEYHALPEQPPVFLNATAAVLPWFELLAGLALVLGVFLRGAAASVALMLIVFTVAIAIRAMGVQAAQGTPFCDIAFDCGCGSGVVVVCTKLAKNTGLIVLALLATFSNSRRFCLMGRRRPTTT